MISKLTKRKQLEFWDNKCAICGRTEADDPELVFRYCSKCVGNYEYCQEHLFTHEHIKGMQFGKLTKGKEYSFR